MATCGRSQSTATPSSAAKRNRRGMRTVHLDECGTLARPGERASCSLRKRQSHTMPNGVHYGKKKLA
eukprot:2867674-Lingulodinium_polyedra.AAC.1